LTLVPPLRRGTTMFLASLRTSAGAVTPLGRRTFSVAARSTAGLAPLDASTLTIERDSVSRKPPPKEELVFGKTFTPHMLEVDWSVDHGWKSPRIVPYQNLPMSPAAMCLHYGLECFEGMKAYKDDEGATRLFRPDCNMARLNDSLERLHMPDFDGEALIECMKELLKVDADWIPEGEGYSMYLRPTAIATDPFLGVASCSEVKLFVIMSPVGPYYAEGFAPVKLYADTENVRAWPGGVGNAKVGGNYGPTIGPAAAAQAKGCAQVLWLFEDPNDGEHYATEVGAMNIFFAIEKPEGGLELCTAPLSKGDILPGVTRRSILELARGMGDVEVSEREVSMSELLTARDEGRLREAFGAGTAAVISPVKSILYKGEDIDFPTGEDIGPLAKRMWDQLLGIQYGRIEHEWSVPVEADEAPAAASN